MFHVVKLVFGYDGYCGDVVVSPVAMLTLLREPFKEWLYKKTWDRYPPFGLDEKDFHMHVFTSTEHWNDLDFIFDPKDAHWLGFRVDLNQHDSECEFVYTTGMINGEIRPDFDKVSMGIVDKLTDVKSTINEIISRTAYRKE